MAVAQQGQVFPLAGRDSDAKRWAYRYRVGGRGSKRLQRGGYESEQAAAEALERVLDRRRREQGLVESPTLAELVDVYLAQHEGEPETTEKLRWLLAKAVRVFGEQSLSQLRSPAIAAWRMTIPAGHRFEATQALRQVLARAVSGGLDPFESWEQLYAVTGELAPRHRPMVLFAAATGRVARARAQRHRPRDPGRVRPPHA